MTFWTPSTQMYKWHDFTCLTPFLHITYMPINTILGVAHDFILIKFRKAKTIP